MILDVSRSTPNEIVYIESGYKPLKPMIYKRQLKFFRKMLSDCEHHPDSPISKLITKGMELNTTFLRHYKQLDQQFEEPQDCFNYYVREHENQMEGKIRAKHDSDRDSILGTYMRINPTLVQPKLYRDAHCNEYDRKIITKYRAGSHELSIQTGRLAGAERHERLCTCQNEIQTLHHVLFNCSLTESIRETHNLTGQDLNSFFSSDDSIQMATILKGIEKLLC